MPTFSKLRAVLDTDTYNEVDDQFALAHLLLSPDQVDLEAVYAAPFFNDRSSGPAEGMEKSYAEILRLLDLVKPAQLPPVFRGSTDYLPDATAPVESAAADDLIARALAPSDDKLYVLAIGAPTNVASALLKEPRIAEHIVVVWLGGHAPHWPNTNEFNLKQDLHASRVLLDSDVPLILLPCHPVSSHLITTVAELDQQFAGHSALGAYLTDIVREYVGIAPGASKVIWDLAASAWLVTAGSVKTSECPSPVLLDDLTWQHPQPNGRRSIQIAYDVDRNKVFADFFAKANQSGSPTG
ncbi:nucleoside hydrolase [soil metagenome]